MPSRHVMAADLGVIADAMRSMAVDGSTPVNQWRVTVREQIAELDRVIAQAQGAQQFMTHALR